MGWISRETKGALRLGSRKIMLACVMIVGISVGVLGGVGPVFAVDRSAARIVGDLEALREGDVLRGHFVQEHWVQKLNKAIRTEGTFVFAPKRGILWQILRPMPITVVVTENGMEQSVAGVPLVRMTKAQMPFLKQVPDLLFAALQGNWGALKKDFSVTPSKKNVKAGKGGAWKVDLVPHEESEARVLFASLSVKGRRFVEEAEATRKNGLKDRFVFTDVMRSSSPLAEDEVLLFDQAEIGK